MAKRRKAATKRKKAAAPRKAKASGHVPVKLLNKRLVRLNNILARRSGGKAYSGNPS